MTKDLRQAYVAIFLSFTSVFEVNQTPVPALTCLIRAGQD
jgi:hypothetical protein